MATTISSRTAGTKATTIPRKPLKKKAARPAEEEVRILAYSLYERRSVDGTRGDAFSDWIEAERQLTHGGRRPRANGE